MSVRALAIPFGMPEPITSPPERDALRLAPVLPAMTRREWAAVFAVSWLLEATGASVFVSTPLVGELGVSTAQVLALLTVDLLCWVLPMLAVFRVFDALPVLAGRRAAAVAGRVGVLIAATVAQALIVEFALTVLSPLMQLTADQVQQLWGGTVRELMASGVPGALAIAVMHLVLQRLHLTRRAFARNAELRADAAAARLQALTAELQPHFLFNALNGIAELVHRDSDLAEAMLLRLSALLRGTLHGATATMIPLGEELVQVGHYLSLQEMRFGTRLAVEVVVPESLAAASVPAMLLQPLVENAIVHGVERNTGPGHVRIAALDAGGRLQLTVTDDGPGPDAAAAPRGTGVGLRNVRERLATLYGGEATLTLERGPEGGAVATLNLPLRGALAA